MCSHPRRIADARHDQGRAQACGGGEAGQCGEAAGSRPCALCPGELRAECVFHGLHPPARSLAQCLVMAIPSLCADVLLITPSCEWRRPKQRTAGSLIIFLVSSLVGLYALQRRMNRALQPWHAMALLALCLLQCFNKHQDVYEPLSAILVCCGRLGHLGMQSCPCCQGG